MTLKGVIAVALRYFTEFGKPACNTTRRSVAEFMHQSIVLCSACMMSVVKKVHVRYLIS